MLTTFCIWIDADSCPTRVRKFIVSYAEKNQFKVRFVANRKIDIPDNALFEMQVCPKESGAADDFIFDSCIKNDCVVTRDIPFAARLVEKGVTVMNDRGTLFTKENIGEKLSERNFNLNLAQLGLGGGGKSSYGEKEFKKFCDLFDREIQKKIIMERFCRH